MRFRALVAGIGLLLGVGMLLRALAGEDEPALSESLRCLREAKFFSLGPVGRGGATPPEARALRTILARGDSAARLEAEFSGGGSETRAYILAGLKLAKSDRFVVRAREAEGMEGKVQVITGDVVRRLRMSEVVAMIRELTELPPVVERHPNAR